METIGNLGFWPLLVLFVATAHSKKVFPLERSVCRDVEIVPRGEWMARAPRRQWSMKVPVNDIIVHHTVTDECRTKPQCLRSVSFIQEYHVDYLGWHDIGYNFLVGGDGRIYEGVGWTRTGAHSINFNTRSVGVAFVGDFRKVVPDGAMLDAALKLIDCGVEKGYLTPTREIHGHRDVACSESPGDQLYRIIRTWKNYKGGRLPLYNC